MPQRFGDDELIRAAVADEETFGGRQAKPIETLLENRPLGLHAPDDARKDLRVEAAAQRRLVPSGDFHEIGVADESELHARRSQAMQHLDVFGRHARKCVSKSVRANPRGLANAVVGYRGIGFERKRPDDDVRIALLTGEAPARALHQQVVPKPALDPKHVGRERKRRLRFRRGQRVEQIENNPIRPHHHVTSILSIPQVLCSRACGDR